jgi:hypothetical protein
VNAMSLLPVTAALEGATGLALLAMPSGTVTLLLGNGLATPRETVVARLAGTAVVAIAVICGAASRNLPNEQRSVLVGLLVYNLSVPVLLVSIALHTGLQWPGVWVASLGHAVLLAWCVACLRALARAGQEVDGKQKP